MSFLGFGNKSEPTTPPLDPAQREIVDKIKSEISQELATGYASALVNAITENCFERCIINNGKIPKSPLSKEEETCIEDCSAKFMISWNIISQSYISRINKKEL